MSLYDVVQDDRDFKVMVNGKEFFHEPLFPILELAQYCQRWIEKPDTDFIYNTIESEENPLLAFSHTKSGWKMESVWKKFECDLYFTADEVKSFIKTLIDQVTF